VSIAAPSPFAAVVIGGGISGLACAYRLQQAGIPARLLEASARPGGLIATREKDGFQFELGPQSFLSTEPLLQLIESLGLKDQLLHADRRAPRYILSEGKLMRAPLAPQSLLTTPLLGATTKWKIFTEMTRHTAPPDGDESVAAFVRRKFGEELLEKLVAPFVSGVYAGDPEKLSLRASFPKLYEFEKEYGSVMKGAMKSRDTKGAPRAGLCSFRRGMEMLPRAIAARMEDLLLTESSVTSLQRGKANGKPWFEIEFARQNHLETIAANAVIVATPTESAGEMLKQLSEQFPAAFARIEYAPVAVVSAGYRRDQIQHPVSGFGFLVPRSEKLRVLGTLWNSSLFPGRCPDGKVSFTSFAGGATDPGLMDLRDEKIVELICGEVAGVLGISGAPVMARVQRYARALPQYNLGHSEIVASLGGLAGSVPGLFLAGNYISGPSIGACVEQANRTADSARMYLASIGATGAGAVAHA
jgi:protoporphyrinogen/coproporphyrinogen III oxidase